MIAEIDIGPLLFPADHIRRPLSIRRPVVRQATKGRTGDAIHDAAESGQDH
jgi:hypothetical protein